MLSEESYRAIGRLLKHLCLLKVIPFDWNSKTFSVKVVEDERIYLTVAVFGALAFHCTYLMLSFLSPMAASERSVHMIWFSAHVLGSVTSYNSLVRRYELATLINHFFRFNSYLKGKYRLSQK
jgi:hypothetical protein